MNFIVNQRVEIVPLSETGTIIKIRQDERNETLIDVQRDSDGETQVCRPQELD